MERGRCGRGVVKAVLGPGQEQTLVAAALEGEPVALLKAKELGAALLDPRIQGRVAQLDALLRQVVQVGEVTAARRTRLAGLGLRWWRDRWKGALGCVLVRGQERSLQRLQGSLGVSKLQLELGRADALGLGDEEAPLEQLHFQLQLLVGAAEPVALPGELGAALLLLLQCGLQGNHPVAQRGLRRVGCVMERRGQTHKECGTPSPRECRSPL